MTSFSRLHTFTCWKTIILPAFFFIALSIPLQATQADSATKSFTVKKTSKEITIDGKLDEEDWEACDTIYLVGYKESVMLVESTECRLLWDDSFLYISWFCTDSDIWGTLTERDEPLYNEEVVEAFINPDSDRETYVELEVNPLGTLWDGKILNTTNGRNADIGWNSELLWAVHVEGTINDNTHTDSCWSVEIAVPLAELTTAANIPPQNGDRWRFNLYRIEKMGPARQTKEYSAWSPVSTDFHDPDNFGEIIFSIEPVRFTRGDTDDNGKIDIFDLLNLLRALNKPSLSEGKPAYDVDDNGVLNIFDLLEMLRKIKG